MAITFSIGDGELDEERGLLERRRLQLPAKEPRSRGDRDQAQGWVLDTRFDDHDGRTLWAW